MWSAWKERQRLEAILISLAGTLYLVTRLHRDFREGLREQTGIAEIRTSDGSVAWHFHIAHGTLRIARGAHPNPNYAIVYKDIPVAVEVMTKGTDEAFLEAMMQGTVVFEGDLVFGMWFNDLLKKLGSVVQEKMASLPLRRFAK